MLPVTNEDLEDLMSTFRLTRVDWPIDWDAVKAEMDKSMKELGEEVDRAMFAEHWTGLPPPTGRLRAITTNWPVTCEPLPPDPCAACYTAEYGASHTCGRNP